MNGQPAVCFFFIPPYSLLHRILIISGYTVHVLAGISRYLKKTFGAHGLMTMTIHLMRSDAATDGDG